MRPSACVARAPGYFECRGLAGNARRPSRNKNAVCRNAGRGCFRSWEVLCCPGNSLFMPGGTMVCLGVEGLQWCLSGVEINEVLYQGGWGIMERGGGWKRIRIMFYVQL